MANADPQSGSISYIWPCATKSVYQEFGVNGHGGMDISCPVGEAVYAAANGTVYIRHYWDGHTTDESSEESWGNYIKIRHPNGTYTLYAHLNSFNSSSIQGWQVKQGTVIGYSGKSGNVTGPHLHFEVYNIYGVRVNPRLYVNPNTAQYSNDHDTGQMDKAGTNITVDTNSTIAPNYTIQKQSSIDKSGSASHSATGSGGATSDGSYEIVSTVEITDIQIHTEGETGKRSSYSTDRPAVITDGAEIIISDGTNYYLPVLKDSITLQQPRTGSPATLKFKVYNDGNLKLDCGNSVSFKWNAAKMFFGYIFTIKASSTDTLEITAYDQLRYLKNKMAYIFKDKTMTQIVKALCKDNGLSYGSLEDTKKKVTLSIAEQSGLDWIEEAANYTVRPGDDNKSGSEYVVYDDFGKVRLVKLVPYTTETKEVETPYTDEKTGEKKTKKEKKKYIKKIKMLCSGFVDNTEIEGFTWEKSIDDQDDMSNQLKLVYDDDDAGVKHVYVYNNAESQSKYGTLVEYFSDSGWEDETTRDYYVKIWKQKRTDPSKTYTAKGVTGATDCRGGSFIITQVRVGLDAEATNTFMLVEEAKHTFEGGRHTMDLTLRGGQYNV